MSAKVAARAAAAQQRRVFWAKFFLCFVALGALLQGSAGSLILLPAAAFCFAPARRFLLEQWANLQNNFSR